MLGRGKMGQAIQETWEGGGVREKGVPESTGSEASAAAAWQPWKMAE
jgi:hypothetical protein